MHPGQAEAALLGGFKLLAAPLDRGVHERGERIVGEGTVDKHAVQHTKLGRGETDPERVVHELPHTLDLGEQHIVEALDRQRGGAQYRIAELAHLTQGCVAACTRLGIELGRGRGALLGLHLGVHELLVAHPRKV